MHPITLDELNLATEVVRRHVPATPQFEWPLLTEAAGSNVVVKHENHTPIGAFKVRGGLVDLDRFVKERPDVKGVISATRGNHGQSLAFAGREYGREFVIYVPHGNSVEKNAAMRPLGAEVVEHGHDFQDAREESIRVADDRGLEAVPSFHRDLVLGVATYARELLDAAGPLDTVYVPVGMGSGIAAMIAVRDLLGLKTAIVGVVSKAAPASRLSFEAGHVVTTESADTFVDGVACRVPDAEAVAAMVTGAARIIEVTDNDAADAMRLLFRSTHNVAEPAGAVALVAWNGSPLKNSGLLAGLLSETVEQRGQRSAFTLCGGNVDTATFKAVLGGATPVPRIG